MQILLSLLLSLLFGGMSAYLASYKGRRPHIWFITGFLLGIIGFIVLLFLPSVKNPASEPPPSAADFYETIPPALNQDEEEITRVLTPEETFQTSSWYYLDTTHQQIGPIDFEMLAQLWEEQKITDATYLWTEDMTGWQHVSELPALQQLLNGENQRINE